MPPPDPVHHALVELAKPAGAADPISATNLVASQPEAFLEAVAKHRLEAALADALERADRPIPEPLARKLMDQRLARLQIKRSVERAVEALDDFVPWAIVKGPAVAALMARPELRIYNDLDILTTGEQLKEVATRLDAAGFRSLNRNWCPYVEHGVGQVPLAGHQTTIDLHWDPVALGRTRRDIRFDVARILERTEPVGLEASCFFPKPMIHDQILLAAINCGLKGAVRLDQFRDLTIMTESAGPNLDWNLLAADARRHGAGRLVANVFDRAALITGTHVPAGWTEELGGWTTTARRRLDRSPSGLRYLPVAVMRDSSWATARAVGEQAIDRLRSRRLGASLWDFGDADGPLYYKISSDDDCEAEFFDLAAQHRP